MPGTGCPFQAAIVTVSPMAKMSGCPGTVRSGSTCSRSARSAGAPSHSAAGGAGADDDEGQECCPTLRIALALGALEGDQDASPQCGGILQRLEARRERLPFVVAEISVASAGGEHERVVGQRVAILEQHAL